jgi:hypothetical protein
MSRCWLQWNAATDGISDASLTCRQVQSNLPFNSKRFRLPKSMGIGGMATPVGAIASKVQLSVTRQESGSLGYSVAAEAFGE